MMAGRDEVAVALRERYPRLSPEQAADAAEALLERAAAAIADGVDIGSVAELPGGDIELSVYRLEHRESTP